MDDLISRKALGIGKCNLDAFENKEYAKGWNSAIEILETAPTINAVEVVRCKECRIGFLDKSAIEGRMYCANWGRIVKADGFCYMAQKEDRPPVVFRKYKPFEPGEVVTAEIDWLKVGDPNIKDVAMALRETMENNKSSDSGGNE